MPPKRRTVGKAIPNIAAAGRGGRRGSTATAGSSRSASSTSSASTPSSSARSAAAAAAFSARAATAAKNLSARSTNSSNNINETTVAVAGAKQSSSVTFGGEPFSGAIKEQETINPNNFPFQGPGPAGVSQSSVVRAMFEDQTRLFRIEDGTRLLFYNDTADLDFVVKIRFDDPSAFLPHGSARWFAEHIPAASHLSATEFIERVNSGDFSSFAHQPDKKKNNNNDHDDDVDSLRSGDNNNNNNNNLVGSESASMLSPVGSVIFTPGKKRQPAEEDKLVLSRYVMDIIAPGETAYFGQGRAIGRGYTMTYGHRPHARADKTAEPLSCEHIYDQDYLTAAYDSGEVSKTAKVYPMLPDGLQFFRILDHDRLLFYNDTEDKQFSVRIDVDAAIAHAGGAAAGYTAESSVRLLGTATKQDVQQQQQQQQGDDGSTIAASSSSKQQQSSTFVITDIISPGAVQPVLEADVHLSHLSISIHEVTPASETALVKPDFVFNQPNGGWDRSLVTSKFVAVFTVLPGKLYRIHDGDRMLFYNDTSDENLDVTASFPSAAHVSPFGSAIRKKARRSIATAGSATTTITDTVFAGRTQMFCKSSIATHTLSVVSRPVPKPDEEETEEDEETKAKKSGPKFTAEQLAAGAATTRRASTLLVDPVTFDFLGPGPMHLTDTARCFCMFEDRSRFFRIVNMGMLFFYNDTATHDFIVRVTFPSGVRVQPAGTAAVDPALSKKCGGGMSVVTDVVPPMATKIVAEHVVNGYRVSFAQRPAVAGGGGANAMRRAAGAAGGGATSSSSTNANAPGGGSPLLAGGGSSSGGAPLATSSSAALQADGAGGAGASRFVTDNSGKRGVAQRALMNPKFSLSGPFGIKEQHLIFECFEEGDGMLFRVVTYPGLNRWYFYNDTVDAEMHVSVKFYAAQGIKPLGSAQIVHSSDAKLGDVDLVSDIILPGETTPFIVAAEIQHFSCNFSAKSVSDANRKRMKEAAAPVVAEERERFAQATHGSGGSQEDAVECCVEEMVNFVDLSFPPHETSIYRPGRDSDDPGFVAWMRPSTAAAADASATHHQVVTVDNVPVSPAGGGGVFQGQKSLVFGSPLERRKGKNKKHKKNQDDAADDEADDARSTLSSTNLSGDDHDESEDEEEQHAEEAATNNDNNASDDHSSGESLNHMSLLAPRYVRDSSILNTWLSCALSALAATPEYIKDVFLCAAPRDLGRRRLEQSLGIHRFSLLKQEWFSTDLVDDFLPCVGRSLCCIRHHVEPTSELWPALLEKAFAKIAGSYGAILGGDPLLALSAVTGFPASRLDKEFHDASADADSSASALLFSCLEEAAHCGNIVLVSTKDSLHLSDAQIAVEEHRLRSSGGMELDRSYHVLDVKHFAEHDNLRLLKVRNNWLSPEHPGWRGAWSAGDKQWQKLPDVAAACGVALVSSPRSPKRGTGVADAAAGAVDGETDRQKQQQQQQQQRAENENDFWIEWRDLLRFAHTGGICYSSPSWTSFRVRTHFNKDDGTCGLAFRVTCRNPTKVIFSASQPGLPMKAVDARFGRPYLSVSLAMLAPYSLPPMLAAKAKEQTGDEDNKNTNNNNNLFGVKLASSRVISVPGGGSRKKRSTGHADDDEDDILEHLAARHVGFKVDLMEDTEPIYIVPHCDLIMESDEQKTLQFCFCCFAENPEDIDVQFVKLEKSYRWFGFAEPEEEEEDEETTAHGHDEDNKHHDDDDDEDGTKGAPVPQAAVLKEGAAPPSKPVDPVAAALEEARAFPLESTPVDEDFQYKVLGQPAKQKHGWGLELPIAH